MQGRRRRVPGFRDTQRCQIRAHDGKVVKWLGDGMMFHFRTPDDGVIAALEMPEAVSAAELPAAHIGLHTGPVVFQGGDSSGEP